MNNEYKEKIICSKCKCEYYRELEVLEVAGKHCELDQPLNVAIIKKFKCKKCKETKNFSIEIVKKNSNKEVI